MVAELFKHLTDFGIKTLHMGRHDAEDLAQDTILKALELRKVNEKNNFYRTMARNTYYDSIRAKKVGRIGRSPLFRGISDMASNRYSENAAVFEKEISDEILRKVLYFLDVLPKTDMSKETIEAFILLKYFGLKSRDVATILAVDINNVTGKVFKARKTLNILFNKNPKIKEKLLINF